MASIEEARACFDKYDANGDGFITAKEYHDAMQALGQAGFTEAVAQAIINAKDTDGDKLLSFDEFVAHLSD